MATIPIHTLTPAIAPPAAATIRATVTLSWPYSSATKQFALLLVDPDSRVRIQGGQVRVRFTGPIGEAVARSHVGIGDELLLRLDGAAWTQVDPRIRISGKSVGGDLEFATRLNMRIVRPDGDQDVIVDATVPPRPAINPSVAMTATPTPQSSNTPAPQSSNRLPPSLGGTVESIPIYSSPAFAKRLRLPGKSFLDSAYDPFLDDGAREDDNDRQLRSSFGASRQWRYADSPPSPDRESVGRSIEPGSEEPKAAALQLHDAQQPVPSREAAATEPTAMRQPETMAPPSLPQSEKEKIMAQTYRSLFGFQPSPEAQISTEDSAVASETAAADGQVEATQDVALNVLEGLESLPETSKISIDLDYESVSMQISRESSPSVADSDTEVTQQQVVVGEAIAGDKIPDVNLPDMADLEHPPRKSLVARLSNVPDVISEYFSPRRSGGIAADTLKQAEDDTAAALETTPGLTTGSSQSVDEVYDQRKPPANGLITSLAYFTPLSRLDEQLNPSSQQAYGSGTIDVFVVVTDRTTEPERAKSGPKDFFTMFKAVDSSVLSDNCTTIEVFRPWKATLPVAEVGDVVLLRNFAVKSRNRQTYLLSTDASAWCVWRYGSVSAPGDDGIKPPWAHRRIGNAKCEVRREEMKGPPVELGEQERRYSKCLRDWWITLDMIETDY